MSPAEVRYRRWMRLYPKRWRQRNEEALIETLLASGGGDGERPDRRVVADLVLSSARVRYESAVAAIGFTRDVDLVRALASYGLVVQAAVAVVIGWRAVMVESVLAARLSPLAQVTVVALAACWPASLALACAGRMRHARQVATAGYGAAIAAFVVRIALGLTNNPVHFGASVLFLLATLPVASMWWSKAWGTQERLALGWLVSAVAAGGAGIHFYGAMNPLRVLLEVDIFVVSWVIGFVLTATVSLLQTKSSQVRSQETLHVEQ